MSKTLIVYHSYAERPCPDGLAAAWVAKKAYPQADLFGAVYDGPSIANLSDYGRLVIVDFSYPQNVLREWIEHGIEVILIDHHKTALNDLSTLIDHFPSEKGKVVFDIEESGATLAWKTFFPTVKMPSFLRYIKDRDLWLFKEPATKEVHAALSELGFSLALFDVLETMSSSQLIEHFFGLGKAKLDQKEEAVRRLAERAGKREVAGYKGIPTVELNSQEAVYTSDLGNLLCKNYPDAPFSACIIEGSKVSLRSIKETGGADVSLIAKQFGGGGHPQASGFTLNN